MKEFLRKLLLAEIEKEQGDLRSYMEELEKGHFRNLLNYGIADKKRGFFLLNPLTDPGALYCGAMGSGKSVAMKYTLITSLLSNGDNTIFLLYDGLKGMTDYRMMFDYTKNVAYAVNDGAKIVPLIDMVYGEMISRKEEFSKYKATNIDDYNKIMKEKNPNTPELARIILAVEEFHTIPTSEYVKFSYSVDTPGSVANQFKELMRVGRSYGLCLLAATQRAVADDIPSTLKVGLSQMMAFRVSNPGDVAAMNISHAADIRPGNPGRCAYMDGFIQFPNLTDPVADWLLKKYYKPLTARCLKYNISDFQKAFSGEGNSGMVLVKPLKDLLANQKQFKPEDLTKRILNSFDFSVENQKNEAYVPNLIAERDGKRYSVLVITNPSIQGTEKGAQALKDAMKFLKTDSVMAVSLDKTIPSAISSLIKKENGLMIDFEDTQRIAMVLDNQKLLEEKGDFEESFNNLPLARKIEKVVSSENLKKPSNDEYDMDEEYDETQDILSATRKDVLKDINLNKK